MEEALAAWYSDEIIHEYRLIIGRTIIRVSRGLSLDRDAPGDIDVSRP